MNSKTEKTKAIQVQTAVLELISSKLQKFIGVPINTAVHFEIYQTIFEALQEVFETSHAGVTNEFMNYVAQHYYDNISFGGATATNPNIFTQRSLASNLSKGELLLAIPLMITDTAAANLIREVKSR